MIRVIAVAILVALASPVLAATAGSEPKQFKWSWEGVFGTYDRAQLQRGLDIYLGQCINCHSLKYIHFRNLTQIGFTADAASDLAASYEVDGPPDEWGDPTVVPAKLSDVIPAPYRNDEEARALNNGALPPDLSLMVKARVDGANYLASLLSDAHYNEGEPDESGLYENAYFPGGKIAMAPPLFPGLIIDDAGNEVAVEEMAKDVTAFLAWTAEPKLEDRKSMGLKVILFLLVLTGLLYVCKRKVWANLKH